MKKVLIGCGIMVLLMVIAVVGIGIFGVRKIGQFGKSMEQAQISLMTLDQDFAFDIPTGGDGLDADRFQEYLAARRALIERTSQVRLVAKLIALEEGQQPDVGAGDILNMVGEIPKLMQAYADTLRAAEMSTEEYAWYAIETLKAIRGAADQGDPEYAKAWAEVERTAAEIETAFAQQQANPEIQKLQGAIEADLERATEGDVPEGDIALVMQAKEQLAKNPEMLLVEVMITLFLNNTYSATGY